MLILTARQMFQSKFFICACYYYIVISVIVYVITLVFVETRLFLFFVFFLCIHTLFVCVVGPLADTLYCFRPQEKGQERQVSPWTGL